MEGENEQGFLAGAVAGGTAALPTMNPWAIGGAALAGGLVGLMSADRQRRARKNAEKKAQQEIRQNTLREFGLRQQRDSMSMGAAMSRPSSGSASTNMNMSGFVSQAFNQSPTSGITGTF